MSEIFASRKFRESGHSRNFACFDGIKFRESARLTHFAGINFSEIGFSETKTRVKLAKKPVFVINKQKYNKENMKLCLMGINFRELVKIFFRDHLISRIEGSFSGRENF